jgi:uncharacterized protein
VIVEALVTTTDSQGRTNLAPMGPHLDPDWELDPRGTPTFTLKPFVGTQTQRNLSENGWAVIHFSDDVSLFARSSIGEIDDDEMERLTCPVADSPVRRLIRCTRYFVVCVIETLGQPPRLTMPCTTMSTETVDPHLGMNRAALAVIEAAILATRTSILPPQEIRTQLDRLKPLVDKTSGVVSRRAFDDLCGVIDARLNAQPKNG